MDVDTIMVLAAAQRHPVTFYADGTPLDGTLVGWPRQRNHAVVLRHNRHLRIPKELVRLPVGGAS